MASITDGLTTIEPLLILNADRSRESRNTILEPIDSPEPYVSLAEARTPTQQLAALFADELTATAGLTMLSSGRVLTITTDARVFECVLAGPARIDRASESRDRWTLEAEVREL